MIGPEVAEYCLNATEQESLMHLSNNVDTKLYRGAESSFIDHIKALGQEVSGSLTELDDFLLATAQTQPLRKISGLPIYGYLEPTPTKYSPPERAEVFWRDVVPLMIMQRLGNVYGSRHVRGGRLINDVIPKPEFELTANSAFNSRVKFGYHIDIAYAPDVSPDYFGLYALRNHEKAKTSFLQYDLDGIDSGTVALLAEPAFSIYFQSLSDDSDCVTDVSILDPLKEHVRYLDGRTIGQTSSHQNALKKFEEHLGLAKPTSVIIGPGEMIVADNNLLLHSRETFIPHEIQALKRWLRRVYVTKQTDILNQEKVATSKFVRQ
jgi:hypothetical protein